MTQPDYGTSGGVPLTPEVIEQAVRDAERGYGLARLRPRQQNRRRQQRWWLVRRCLPWIVGAVTLLLLVTLAVATTVRRPPVGPMAPAPASTVSLTPSLPFGGR